MSSIFVLTDEIADKIHEWRYELTSWETVNMLKQSYPSAFRDGNLDFSIARELDELIFDTSGAYWRQAYNFPEPGVIYQHTIEDSLEVYRCPHDRCGYFTFEKEVILSPEQVTWAMTYMSTHIIPHSDESRRAGISNFPTSFIETFYPSGQVNFETLRWLDIITTGSGYSYSRLAYPGDVNVLYYCRGDGEPYFYRVTDANYMTCTVTRSPAGDARNWRAHHWYAYLRAEVGTEPSDEVVSVIDMLDRSASERVLANSNE